MMKIGSRVKSHIHAISALNQSVVERHTLGVRASERTNERTMREEIMLMVVNLPWQHTVNRLLISNYK